MTNIIDQTNDPGFSHLRVVVDRYPQLREMCKTANMDTSEFQSLPDAAFAWPGQRKFPIHNKEHAGLSVGYSKLASELPTDISAKLEKAAAIYGVSSAVFDEPTVEKVASTAQFLLPEKQRLRIDSAQDVPRAEQAFHNKYAHLSVEDRATAAHNLVKIAQQHAVDLSPQTLKLAGFTMTSTRTLRDWVRAREEAATKLGSAIADAYRTVADAYNGPDRMLSDRGDQVKLAKMVSALDEQAGLTQHYGRKLPTPIETVFNTTKVASDFVKVGSALQNKELLQGLPLTFWQDTLGDDIAQEIAPNGQVDMAVLEQILPTLPDDLKSALETQLAAYNV